MKLNLRCHYFFAAVLLMSNLGCSHSLKTTSPTSVAPRDSLSSVQHRIPEGSEIGRSLIQVDHVEHNFVLKAEMEKYLDRGVGGYAAFRAFLADQLPIIEKWEADWTIGWSKR